MPGIHGKNVELRVSTTESVLSGINLPLGDGAGGDGPLTGKQQFQAIAASRDWKYDPDRTRIHFTEVAVQGEPDNALTEINTQNRLINYAAGAVDLGPYPGVASGVFAQAVSMELALVGNLIGDARSFTLGVTSDTVETTLIGDSWKNFVDGLQAFEGSLDGLYVDNYWYKQAIATLSGVIPQRVLKFIPDPKDADTYYQGTVIFPEWEITGGVDAAIEHSVPFQGRGPLDHVADGLPFFNLSEVF